MQLKLKQASNFSKLRQSIETVDCLMFYNVKRRHWYYKGIINRIDPYIIGHFLITPDCTIYC